MTPSVKKTFINTTRLTSKKTPTFLTAFAMATTIMMVAPAAYGQTSGCSPDNTGTSGNDIITCTGSQGVGVPFNPNGFDGDDTIIATNANADGVNWDLIGNADDDRIEATNSIINDIRADGGIGIAASGNDGNDTVILTNSTVTNRFFFGGGDDTLTATNSTINSFVASIGGNETITLTNSLIDSSVNIEDGLDTVVLDNSTIDGSLTVGNSSSDDGADIVTLSNNSEIDGNINLGEGNDSLTATDSIINGSINSTGGDDSVILTNVMDVNSINISDGADTVLLDNTILSGTLDVGLNNDNDGADNVTVTNGSSVGGTVDLGFDDDIVTISGGSFIGGPVQAGAGNDTILVTGAGTLVDGSDVFGGDGNDVITIASGAMVGGSSGTEGVVGGDGDDIVNIDGGIVSGFVNLENGDDTAVFDAASTINTTATFFVEGDAGSDNITVNGGTYDAGIQLGVSGDDPADFDELVINGSTINGPIQFGQGNDLVTVNGGTLTEGLGVVGTEFNEDTITINGGVIGTSNAGNAIFTGIADDQVGIFGGDVQSTISLGGDNDLVVIDAGGDEFTGAMTQVFVQNGFTNETAPTLDLDHSVTGGALIATPTEFIGGSGDDVAEIFDLVDTENLDFESFNDVNFYGLSITLADDASGEASQAIDNLRLLRGSTLTQTTGRLDIVAEGGATGGVSTLIVDGTSQVTLQDGVVDDLIDVQTFAPQTGSLLSVDVDTFTEGLDLDDSDYIIGGTHTPEAGAIVNVNVLDIAGTSQRGSRRIVDSNAANVEAPELGDLANPSQVYVLQNDPSFGARQFWLQDDANGGVYLVWTTPVSPVTMAAILGGQATSSDFVRPDGTVVPAFNPDGTLNLLNPNLRVDPNAKGAGLNTLAAGQTSSFLAGSINDNGAGSVECQTGRKDWNLWGNLGYETGEYGQNELDTGTTAIGAEKDISGFLNAECGRHKVGIFAFTAHSEIDQPLTGSSTEPNQYGVGLYLKASTESNFYGSILGYVGETDYTVDNAVLESRASYDTEDWGVRLDVGKLIPFENRNMDADIRGYIGLTSSNADQFSDSNGFEITSIDNDGLTYGASIGLNKYYENNQKLFGRIGIDFNDIESDLLAYTIPVTSEPSYTLGNVEAGYENTTENGQGTLRLSGLARFGSDSEAYGGRLTGIVRF